VPEVFVQHLPPLMTCSAAQDWFVANGAARASARIAIADLRILLSLRFAKNLLLDRQSTAINEIVWT
jgi:hypothetical protein